MPMASLERRRLLGPHLDVTQGFGNFLRLRLEIFGEHIKAPSDDTGDHPQDHQKSKESRHRGARVPKSSCRLSLKRFCSLEGGLIMNPFAGRRTAPDMMNDSKGRCQHEKIVEPCGATHRLGRPAGAAPSING
jgi:hypothetical protein